MLQWRGGTSPVTELAFALTWTVCEKPHHATIPSPAEEGLRRRQSEVTAAHLLSAITVNWILCLPSSSFFFLPFLVLPFAVLLILFFFPWVWPSLSMQCCHHGNLLLCCRTPPSPPLSCLPHHLQQLHGIKYWCWCFAPCSFLLLLPFCHITALVVWSKACNLCLFSHSFTILTF